MKKLPFKYNPAFQSDEELIESFVVRHADLEIVMNTIRENTVESNRHVLAIGPRGIGKTTLVLRAVAEVRRDEALNQKWRPILFAEESYQVGTPGEFWLEAIYHLGNQTEDARWRQVFEELKQESDEKRLHDRALAKLLDYADSIQKRLLLVVENLNMLFGDLLTDNDAWTLRHTLLNEPRIMLLSSATTRFEQMESSGKAMFDLFKQLDLKPLDEEECKYVWESVSGVTVKDNRIRPVQILTGGNPRLVTIISAFGAQMSFEELMEDLIHLVDEHTEYFKSQLDNLAATERKVYLALIERWDPSTARQVAEDARLDVNKTSALLRRLVERGAVVVAEESPRLKLYQVAERMYNIYYLMRKRSGSMTLAKAVVRFMCAFYSPEDLLNISKVIATDICKSQLRYRTEHFEAWCEIHQIIPPTLKNEMLRITPKEFYELPETPAAVKQLINSVVEKEGMNSENLSYEYKQLQDLLVQAEESINYTETYSEAEGLYRHYTETNSKDINALNILGSIYIFFKKYNEAENVLNKALEIDPNDINTLINIGINNINLNKHEDALKTFTKATEIDPKNTIAWEELGHTYFILTNYKSAKSALMQAVDIDPKDETLWLNLGNCYFNLENYDNAIKAYLKAADLDPNDNAVWMNLGHCYINLTNYEIALSAFLKAVDLDPNDNAAWMNLGLCYFNLANYESALNACLKATDLDPNNNTAWMNLGFCYFNLKDYERAINAYLKALDLYPDYTAWMNLGFCYTCATNYESAINAFLKALEIDPNDITAWMGLGIIYSHLKRYKEAETAYQNALKNDPKHADALHRLGMLFSDALERYDEAESLFTKAIEIEPKNATIYNSMAWSFYKSDIPDNIRKAEQQTARAYELEPDNFNIIHTYACILARVNSCKESLDLTKRLLSEPDYVKSILNEMITLFTELAASGCAKESIELIENSPSAVLLESMVVGMRLYLGEKVNIAVEIKEVGKDVAKKIKARKLERERMEDEVAFQPV